jgi:hypothetical protein
MEDINHYREAGKKRKERKGGLLLASCFSCAPGGKNFLLAATEMQHKRLAKSSQVPALHTNKN